VKLSVVIPAHDEAGSIGVTVSAVADTLADSDIDYEVIVVDDASTDGTFDVAAALAAANPRVRCLRSHYPPGFGLAVRAGLEAYTGDAVAIVMADLSDSPADLVDYFRALEQGYDCAFGSRFMAGSEVSGYPWGKLALNRIVNFGIRVIFRHGYSDTTNAFKAYRREVIDAVQPLLSNQFNLTVELPLKSVVRGYSYAVMPISWRNRTAGESKLRLKEMGSRYLFIVLYVWLEHHLSRGDYRRRGFEVPRFRRRFAPGLSARPADDGAASGAGVAHGDG